MSKGTYVMMATKGIRDDFDSYQSSLGDSTTVIAAESKQIFSRENNRTPLNDE